MELSTFCALLEAAEEKNIAAFKEEFVKLMAGLDIQAIITRELKKCRDDHKAPPSVLNWTTMTLHGGKWFNLDLTVDHTPAYRDTLVSHVDSLISFIAPAQYRLYGLQNFSKQYMNPDAHLTLVEEGTFKPGDSFYLDSSQHMISLRSDDPVIFVSLSCNFIDEHACKFDVNSGKLLSYFNTSPVTSVVELMAKFLGTYGGTESIDCLESLLSHRSDMVRWQAAKAMGQIDYDAGIRAFRQLATAASPAMRKAATETLKQTLGAH